MKIGLAWADTTNRLDQAAVLACCGEQCIQEQSKQTCTMGVDTGKDLHVVISRWVDHGAGLREVVWIGTRSSYAELGDLMKRYEIGVCVIDALPEIHATREFANRFGGLVFLNYFVESQRGSYAWDWKEHIVRVNRTEALDASRMVIRNRKAVGRVVGQHGRGIALIC